MKKIKFLKYVYIFSYLLTISCLAFAENKEKELARTAQPSQIHPLAENLAKVGAFSCAERGNQIANFLSDNNKSDLIFQTPKDNPNNRLLMSTMVIPNSNYENVVGGISLAPNQINGCGGSYHLVFYTIKQCSQAASEIFPSVKFQSINKTKVQIGIAGRGLWILAMAADKGCVFIKEQLIE